MSRARLGGDALFLLLLLLLAAVPTFADAQTSGVAGRSSTYVQGFVRPAGSDTLQHVPFYEMVDLNARRLGISGLSLHTSFWGLVDFVDLQDRYRATGDVTTLYLSYRAPAEGPMRAFSGLELVGGRQLVALGPTLLEQVDGGKVHYLHRSGLEIGLFGGAVTGTRVAFMPWPSLDDDRFTYGYNWLVGGRLGFIDLGQISAGVSFVHRRYRAAIADNDLGVDLSYSPLSRLDLSGSAIMSLEALRPKEGRGSVAISAGGGLSFNLSYHYSSPDLYLPRSSIFSVFSDEMYQEANLDLRWQPTRALTLDLGYGRRFYSAVGDARDGADGKNRIAFRGTLRFGQDLGGRLLAEVERVEGPTATGEGAVGGQAATRFRAATAIPFYLARRTISLIVDVDLFALDEPIRDNKLSFTGGGFLELGLRRELRLMAGGTGTRSPLLSRAGTFLARLVWEFDTASDGAVQVQRGRLQ